MTFGADHYVPILKVKRGEKKALQSLRPAVQQRITPLLEIVERREDKSRTLREHLDTAFNELALSVRPYSRCFLDTREIATEGPLASAEVFRRAYEEGIEFTPVTGLSRSADVSAAMAYRKKGIALRLTRSEFESGHLTSMIQAFIRSHNLLLEDVDLIIDLGALDDFIVDGVVALAQAFLVDVPDQLRWRTLTISACAFPLSMRGVDRNSHDLVERAEWRAWRDHFHAQRDVFPRVPTFSDCAIQHPSGVEGFNPQTMQVSASVRYTAQDSWLLIKGEGRRSIPLRLQYPSLATSLVYGHLKSHFSGASHCHGCAMIRASANGNSGLGSPEVWRRIGTIHHLTTVAENLAALPSP